MGTPIFKISDGETTVNLINKTGSGINVLEYQPARQVAKDGGVWADSSIANGRQLQMRKWANIIDVITLGISGSSQNIIIEDSRKLTNLLEKAVYYFTTEWQNEPVWIERRASDEENSAYALIYGYQWGSDNNPFAPPFYVPSKPYAMSVELAIEHGSWLSSQPGEGEDVSVSNVYRDEGRSATTSREVYVGNKTNDAKLTHVYHNSGAAWSANLLGETLPYELYPNPLAVDDALYIGSTEGIFCSAIFDIVTGSEDTEITWEYYNGTAWATLSIVEEFESYGNLSVTGVGALCWLHPSNWSEVDANTITAYWVRGRITTADDTPEQGNRNIYTVLRNSVLIDEEEISGDIPALSRISFRNTSETNGKVSKIIMALRSCHRGEDFVTNFNASQEQNPTGILTSGAAAVEDSVWAPSGQCRRSAWAAPTAISLQWSVTILSLFSQQYYGRYRIFARGYSTTAEGDVESYIEVSLGSSSRTKTVLNRETRTNWHYFDYGIINIPPSPIMGQYAGEVAIKVYAGTTASYSFDWIDIILVPVDEFAVEINQILAIATSLITTVDSLSYIGKKKVTSVYGGDTDDYYLITEDNDDLTTEDDDYLLMDFGLEIVDVPRIISSDPLILQANSDQKLYWFILEESSYEWLGTVTVDKNERYLTFRGET